ncbi:hypothetical protein BCR44DRAFT_48206 [Catenaria anguillulae PL171]|uniref:Uncharacterized protein n=1 Tax=Catenaria anguillulae PL171 TaxID=765915 RepID=A0A1Y2HVW4_9FUNG|nr:hypothetical protein BCR44DRAFT_48206 [Catenaria anguillulae PL171]
MSHFLTSFDRAPTAAHAPSSPPPAEPAHVLSRASTAVHRSYSTDRISDDDDDGHIVVPDSPPLPSTDSRRLYYLTELPAPPRPPSPLPPPRSPSRTNSKASSASPTPPAGLDTVVAGKVTKSKSRSGAGGKKDSGIGKQANTLLKYFSSSSIAARSKMCESSKEGEGGKSPDNGEESGEQSSERSD